MFYNESGLLESGSKVHAVDDVSFSLPHDNILGLVGESGCGKTTLARTILLLTKPTAGKIFFDSVEITSLSNKKLTKIRPNMQMIFQDPDSSLDPRMKAKDIVAEPLKVVKMAKSGIEERVEEVFRQVGLKTEQLNRFPNEFSGGQKQRVAIARAISTKPKLIVLDEPTSALDASTQANILNLLQDLKEQYRVSYLFISHNVNVVNHISDRIAVMYVGKIVEIAYADRIMKGPKHPYTWALIHSVPSPNPRLRDKLGKIKGETPSAVNPPHGCRYHPRCAYATDICREIEPPLSKVANDHFLACHHPLNDH